MTFSFHCLPLVAPLDGPPPRTSCHRQGTLRFDGCRRKTLVAPFESISRCKLPSFSQPQSHDTQAQFQLDEAIPKACSPT